MGLLEERAEAISGEFDSEDVSNTLWAYARMGRKPGERLMGLLEERAEAISGEFDSQDVSDSWCRDSQKWDKRERARERERERERQRDRETVGTPKKKGGGKRLMELLKERSEAISGEFDSDDVSKTLCAYARMGSEPGEGLMGLLEGRMEAISGEFDSDDVSKTLCTYARMGSEPGEGLMGLLEGRMEAI